MSSTRPSRTDMTYDSSPGSKQKATSFFPSTMTTTKMRLVVSAGVFTCLTFLALLLWHPPPRHLDNYDVANPITPSISNNITSELFKPAKPQDFKIVALVFYGRPRFVNILDCYLKQNLVTNGGFLDEVRFMVNTKHERDIEWLDELIKTDKLYSKVSAGEGDNHFDNIWTHATEENTMYIKIDDDVLYVHENTIPSMVKTLLAHPEAHDVAANIVNSPLAHWLHYHTDAIYPYVPETSPPAETNEQSLSWRPSRLPMHASPLNETWEFPKREGGARGNFKIGSYGGPPFKNHRWLPLNNTPANLDKTPIKGAQYNPFGPGWTEWTIAAQQHYSLFENLEKGTIDKYWAGNGDGVWNMQYTRYNLNFLAIWGSSVAMKLPGRDDEEALTVTIPKLLKRPCLVDTRAVIGHFSFGSTPELETTDLLSRYLAYANEKVCAKDNQKHVLSSEYMDTTPWH